MIHWYLILAFSHGAATVPMSSEGACHKGKAYWQQRNEKLSVSPFCMSDAGDMS